MISFAREVEIISFIRIVIGIQWNDPLPITFRDQSEIEKSSKHDWKDWLAAGLTSIELMFDQV